MSDKTKGAIQGLLYGVAFGLLHYLSMAGFPG
jgi:hypothetical protein